VTDFARLTAALAGRYRVERELGAGGMATVFVAHDLKHDREVAIKVLRPALAQSITGERFLREIGITARLNHPHVLALLDSGDAGDGEFVYYVMPVATGESLRDRLEREGALPMSDAVRLASEVTEALAHAHGHDVVHRDIKPANVLLSGGHAVVADFGIAKAVGHARDEATLTRDGVSLGTPVYMAPEQISGSEIVDHRADLYAVGVMLYEMLTGTPPFAGTLQQIFADKLTKDAPSLALRCPTAPAALVHLVASCLARDVEGRPASADALLAELKTVAAELSASTVAPARTRNRLTVALGAVSLIVIAVLAIAIVRDRRVRWVHETAIPTIGRLIEADQLDSAFALATAAAGRTPDDSVLGTLWRDISQTQAFLSEPSGATVTRAPVNDTTRWVSVGTTPTAPVRIPNNAWFYRYTKPGYRTVTIIGARLGGSYVPIPSPIPLRRTTDPDSDMVQLRGGRLTGTLYGLSATDTFQLADFLMDQREVTNRQYRGFVNAGGYANRRWWDSTIVRDGQPIAWDAAMASFIDKTGRPGPSSWEGGSPPVDADELPVGGVSWYEARAYARWAGKELPTVYEWNAAAIPEAARWVVPHGRYESNGPVRGGDARGVSPRGVYDMAGNVREWTVNPREPGSRYILGGGWSDPQYLFSEIYTQPELDRSAINGIRLVKRLGTGKDLQAASAPIPGLTRDYKTARPVDDATYRGYLAQYDYDHTPLNAKVESRDTMPADWIREEVTFDVPSSGGRMPAVLFLPKRVKAPYQTVVVWPASDVFALHDRGALSLWFVDYLVRGGRAVLYPIYEHTYGRGGSIGADHPDSSIAHRDQMLRWAKEMRRAIDYAVTRPDVDSTRLAYVGYSWGSRLAGVMMAIEPRFKAGVLNVPGLTMAAMRPEEDPVNFLPRVRAPVLMLSGRYDSNFPYELSQKPFFRLLGSPAADKRQIVYEGGHFVPRADRVIESTRWLDKYLGPVTR
jgi:serine/threonine protein kinase/dienelactone hydrolase